MMIFHRVPENYTLASLLKMWRSWHRTVNYTWRRQDYNRPWKGGTTWSKMLLSAQKSECTFFSTNSHKIKWQPTLTVDSQTVRYNTTQQFLDVTYDCQHTFFLTMLRGMGYHRPASYYSCGRHPSRSEPHSIKT